MQNGSNISGKGQYPSPGPIYNYEWNFTGNLSGTNFSLVAIYYTGAIGTVLNMSGHINPNGTIDGTWNDNYGGYREGTWSSLTGQAKVARLCGGKGTFNYSDVGGLWYTVTVSYVSVQGNDAWFAGEVVDGNVGVGSWLIVEVHDGGEPAYLVDKLGGTFCSEDIAKYGVAYMQPVEYFPTSVTSGNLQVH